MKLWTEWEASLNEGERAPNFLQKERFLAGLNTLLQEKVRAKFPEMLRCLALSELALMVGRGDR